MKFLNSGSSDSVGYGDVDPMVRGYDLRKGEMWIESVWS